MLCAVLHAPYKDKDSCIGLPCFSRPTPPLFPTFIKDFGRSQHLLSWTHTNGKTGKHQTKPRGKGGRGGTLDGGPLVLVPMPAHVPVHMHVNAPVYVPVHVPVHVQVDTLCMHMYPYVCLYV
jgi:hypothetical protein